jgi:hypothetical protein
MLSRYLCGLFFELHVEHFELKGGYEGWIRTGNEGGGGLILKYCRRNKARNTEENYENKIAALTRPEPGTSRIRNRTVNPYTPTLDHSRGRKVQQRPRGGLKTSVRFFIFGRRGSLFRKQLQCMWVT